MKIELELDDDVANRFIKSYDKNLLNGDCKAYMRNVEDIVQECIKGFMNSEFVMSHGGVLLDTNIKSK